MAGNLVHIIVQNKITGLEAVCHRKTILEST